MDTNQVSILLALLSFLALGIAAGVVLLLMTRRVSVLAPLRDLMIPLAFVIALTATLGSLYYSGIAHFRPCRLCWWQRIAMYPLVPLLAVGLLRRDRGVAFYALPLVLVGAGYGIYHTQLRWWPEQGSSCEAEAACTSVWVNTFDFVSIPFMATAGFLAVGALLVASIVLDRTRSVPISTPDLQEVSS